MCSVFRYSAIAAKISAMKSRLITADQYGELAGLESVPQAVGFLRGLPAYAGVFAGTGDEELHRGQIEQLLSRSLYRDFSALYRFANVSQRKFLDLYFMHLEIDILKKCLRDAIAGRRSELDLSMFEAFFDRHSHLDLIELSEADSLTAFIGGLAGSPYREALLRLEESGAFDVFDYEMTLDLQYFSMIWRRLKHDLPAAERDVIMQCIGEKIDLLNLEWLSRAKRYYAIGAGRMEPFLIPIRYRLSQAQLKSLEAAPGPEEFVRILQTTSYRNKISVYGELSDGPVHLKKLYRSLLNQVYRSSSKKHPYTAAALNSYLYFKEEEQRKIITAVEGIRYRLDREEILSYLAEF